MRTVAVIQCRLDSQRLPNKALEKIGDATVLAWVVYRTRRIKLDGIVVATTDLPSDDAIVEECRYLDVDCIRGPADDVLSRFLLAATDFDATHILRVTADCPLLDPWLNQKILNRLAGDVSLDYVGSSGWSEGVGQEAFTCGALCEAHLGATDSYDREHVVPWMLRNLNCAFVGRQVGKLSVDTQEDLDLLRRLYELEPWMFRELSAR